MADDLAFLLPAVLDKNFKKAQIFCNSRHLSDLVGETWKKKNLENNIYDSLASWLTKELKNLRCDKKVGKLNGENSHSEKERVTKLFQEGYDISVLKVSIIWINYQDFSRYWFQQMLQQWGLISVIWTWALISVKITTSLCNDFTRLNFHRVAKDNLET